MSMLDITKKLETLLADLQTKKNALDAAQVAVAKASTAYNKVSADIALAREELFKRVNEQLNTHGVEAPKSNVTQSS